MTEQVRILCVDDEKNVLRALERLFIDEEYSFIVAQSGQEGLEKLRAAETVQVVISDYRMPGMNGVEFLKQVCRERPETIRIVLSGYADTAVVVAAINEGHIYRFIPKPWNDDELKVTVARAVETYFLNAENRLLRGLLAEAGGGGSFPAIIQVEEAGAFTATPAALTLAGERVEEIVAGVRRGAPPRIEGLEIRVLPLARGRLLAVVERAS